MAFTCHKAIRRISALQSLLKLIKELTAFESKASALKVVATWVNCWQSGAVKMMHYTDGLHGSGNYFEDSLRSVFQEILIILKIHLEKTEDLEMA